MEDLSLHASFPETDPADVRLADGEVHVWAVPLTGDPESAAALLCDAEHDRVRRFRFADHQRRYQIGHGALRCILAGYLGCGARDVEFRNTARGKPYLTQPQPFFNLSHSGKLALIAIAPQELGVDLEKVRHLESLTPIARQHFSDNEFAALDRLDGGARELAFYRCWTRKEAYIKALGEGLTLALDSFEVSVGEEPCMVACHDEADDPRGWSLLDVSPGPEFVAALAMRSAPPTVRTFRFAVT